MNLALFDFDGTITNCDTFTRFLHYSLNYKVKMIGAIRLSPYILAYKLGILKENIIRTQLCRVGYAQCHIHDIENLGRNFAQHNLPQYIRENALQRILWHKQQGDKIVVVSSSLQAYLQVWCQLHELDLICNQLEVKDGKLTGHLLGGDCGYLEKAIRIQQRYNLSEFKTIYAYGDSENDRAMLALAHKKFYCWQEI